MQKLLSIISVSLLCAFLSDNQSKCARNEHGELVWIRRDKLFYFMAVFLLATFVGLRTRGNDTFVYRVGYEATLPGLYGFESIDWRQISGAPGLEFLKVCCKTLGFSTQDYFMLTSCFAIGVYLWFIRKYSRNIMLPVYFFITMGVFNFALAAIKQTMAVAFLMIATDNAIQKKWLKYAFWLVIAELFHPYSFIYLIVPFLTFSPWSGKTYFLMAGTVVVVLFMNALFGAIDAITETLGYDYDVNIFKGAGVNIFRVAVVWVPIILSFFVREQLRRSTDRTTNMIINLATINAVIMFIGIFGTANFFARLANYFLMFQVVALPRLFYFFPKPTRKLLSVLSVVAFALYFYYEMNVVYGTFDNRVHIMSLFDYIFKR